MVFVCYWPNCSNQFDDQQKFREHLMDEHLGEQQQKAAATDENGTTSQHQTMMVSKVDKKQIWLPVETWVDILSFNSRIELAQTVSLTNWLFNAISRPRIDGHNKRIVRPMTFSNDGYGMAKLQFTFPNWGAQIPIAQVHPPINILGFERLNFRYINDQVLEFMRLIKPILGTNVCLGYRHFQRPQNCIHQLCNIIKGNVSKLVICAGHFNFFNMEFLKTIQFVQIKAIIFIDARLTEWMYSPLDDNKPRYLSADLYYVKEWAEIFKKRFLESIVPVSFVIHIDNFYGEAALFSIENHQTGEQLTLGWRFDEGRGYLLLCRSKIGDDQ